MRKLYHILTFVAMLGAIPVSSYAQAERDDLETEVANKVSLVVNGSNVKISNANGSTLEIYTITGMLKSTYRIENNEVSLTLNLSKGCYLLKVGKTVRKITIK